MITLNCELWKRKLIYIAAAAWDISALCVCVSCLFVSIQKSLTQETAHLPVASAG